MVGEERAMESNETCRNTDATSRKVWGSQPIYFCQEDWGTLDGWGRDGKSSRRKQGGKSWK